MHTDQPVAPSEPIDITHDADISEAERHLPPLSIWPVTLAAGITLSGMGLVTNTAVLIVGLVIMAVAIVSWIQELRHEHAETH